jgi:hypothetical protein
VLEASRVNIAGDERKSPGNGVDIGWMDQALTEKTGDAGSDILERKHWTMILRLWHARM